MRGIRAAKKFRALIGLLWCLCAAPVISAERVASLNLCLDQIILQWLPSGSIVSVTWLSAQPPYRGAPLPEHIYLNRARAEELLPLKPDLVLTGQFGAARAAARLQQMGFPVVKIPDAYSLEQLQQQLQVLTDTLGDIPALEARKKQLDELVATKPVPADARKNPTAVILSANNITYGSGMLEHQLLTRAGFTNLAAEQGVDRLGRVSLEQVIDAAPDLLVFYGGGAHFAIAHLAERHPVVKRYIDSGRSYHLPAALAYCPALAAMETLHALQDKRLEIVGQK